MTLKKIGGVFAVLALCPVSFAKDCDGIGEKCGDRSTCTGMETKCGDYSLCSGIDSTCGAYSKCTGSGTECGPYSFCTGIGTTCGEGSKCTGLGADCKGSKGGKKKKSSWDWKPFKPLKFKPMAPAPAPAEVHNHGCDTGNDCKGRSGTESNGVRYCCAAGCTDCSVSISQSNDVLTATCVCDSGDGSSSHKEPKMEPMKPMKPLKMEPMKPMKPLKMEPMKPMKPFKPLKFGPVTPPSTVHLHGCASGADCNGHSTIDESNGVELCCADDCSGCSISTSESDDVLTATCVCPSDFLAKEVPSLNSTEPAQQEELEELWDWDWPWNWGSDKKGGKGDHEEPMEPMKPMKPMEPMKPLKFEPGPAPKKEEIHGCETGDVCHGRSGSESNGEKFCCAAGCADCSASIQQQDSVLKAKCVCNSWKLSSVIERSEATTNEPRHNSYFATAGVICGLVTVSAAVLLVKTLGRQQSAGEEPLLA